MRRDGGDPVDDVLMLALVAVLFLAALGLQVFCDRMIRPGGSR
jgi:hypothetical protein